MSLHDLEALQDRQEVFQACLKAAQETAQLLYLTSEERQVRFDLTRMCQKLNKREGELRRLLVYDPCLPTCRLANLGELCIDGQTPLHVAAAFGNVKVIQICVELTGCSVWIRDLQGRTPLHIAASKNQDEVCSYLRTQMFAEKNKDPVGIHAPIDLAGTTPLGQAKIAAKGRVPGTLSDRVL
jgi:hypothetical protein